MGATASRSSPTGKTKTTCLVTRMYGYSNFVRVPAREPRTFDTILFNGLYWDVTAQPGPFEEGLAESIHVAVALSCEPRHRPDQVLEGIEISIEVLDETGEGTVFQREGDLLTLQPSRRLILVLPRRELEVSSCLRNDSFAVRCILSKKRRETEWRCLFSKSDKKLAVVEPQVAMAGSHVLTVGSFSKLKAALKGGDCTYSTHFAVGGCRWYFQFSPIGVIGLVRASNDRTPTTAEFSFELEGAVNFESEKMTHTWHRATNSRYLYRFKLEPTTSATHDRLIVRCRLAVLGWSS